MSRKQKKLTVVALVLFSAIIVLHYIPDFSYPYGVYPLTGKAEYSHYVIQDVRMPLFVLAVFYTGCSSY